MKGVALVVLFVGVVCALPKPQKRSLDCSGSPDELSGRIFMVTYDGYSSTPIETHFNIDLKLQRFQGDMKAFGFESKTITDFKEGTTYIIDSMGCYATYLQDDLPFAKHFGEATQLAKGSQGLKGSTVEFYEFKKNSVQGVFTLQSGGQCIPVSFSYIDQYGTSAGNYFDLKATADPEKLKIPEECKHQKRRRLISAVTHDAGNLNNKITKILKRSIPLQLLTLGQHDTQK